MGLFTKENCSICNKEIGLGKQKLSNGFICMECIKKCHTSLNFKSMTIDDVNLSIEKKIVMDNEKSEFKADKSIGTNFQVDFTKRKFVIPNMFNSIKNSKLYNLDDVIEVEILEDGDSVVKSNGLGRAVVGGLFFGVAGAVVGGVTGKKNSKSIINSLRIKITLNDLQSPTLYINLITGKTKSDSLFYKIASQNAHEIVSLLTVVDKNKSSTNINNSFCTKCGSEIIEGNLFCGSCGSKIKKS